MCELCVAFCKEIEKTFGHRVKPESFARFIENKPIPCPICGKIGHHMTHKHIIESLYGEVDNGKTLQSPI